MVYLFTDGFADQFGGKQNKKYKYLHFKKLLTSIAPLPVDLQKEKIENEFIEWKGDFEQLDDICVLGFRV
jgi:serine phosphatase RsbU (regulator of sigma subunit)